MNREDVRVREGGDRFRFALESRPSLAVGSELRRQHLNRNVAIKPGVACAIHLAHAACANLREEFVGADARAWREGHGWGCGDCRVDRLCRQGRLGYPRSPAL